MTDSEYAFALNSICKLILKILLNSRWNCLVWFIFIENHLVIIFTQLKVTNFLVKVTGKMQYKIYYQYEVITRRKPFKVTEELFTLTVIGCAFKMQMPYLDLSALNHDLIWLLYMRLNYNTSIYCYEDIKAEWNFME